MSLLREAMALGLTGWVRNTADGRVVFLASGAPESVAALLDWARHGPPHAKVDALHVEDVQELPPGGFEVRY